MPAETALHFPPNIPITLSLVDPEGLWDSDLRQGSYRTTTGQTFTLPRAAVVLLNQLEPRPSEEIQITKLFKGKRIEWTVCLTPRSERFRAIEECEYCGGTGEVGPSNCPACNKRPIPEAQDPSELVSALQDSITRAKAAKPVTEAPRLLKKGTGTDDPVPAMLNPARALPAVGFLPFQSTPQQKGESHGKYSIIPWNVAFREVSAWVARELKSNDLQWSDESQKSLCCTVLIAEVKAGRIGPWERPE